MKLRSLANNVAIVTLATGVASCEQHESLSPDEALLFSKLDAATANDPPLANDIISAFDLPEACRDEFCLLEPGKIGELSYDSGKFGQDEDGLILALEGFTGSCIRSEQVRRYFGTGEPDNSCDHHVCLYTSAQREWGILTFALEDHDSQCVSSAIINSLPMVRAVPTFIDVNGRSVCIENCDT